MAEAKQYSDLLDPTCHPGSILQASDPLKIWVRPQWVFLCLPVTAPESAQLCPHYHPPTPCPIPEHLLEMRVGWCWLLGLFPLLGGTAALNGGPGLRGEGDAWLGCLVWRTPAGCPGQLW